MKIFYDCKLIFRLIVFAAFFSFAFGGCQPEIVNLSDAKKRVKSYYESGKFDEEVNSIVEEAIDKLENMKLTERSAAIFDVDETALSNYEYTKKLGFGYTWQSWDNWVKSAKATAVPGIKKLYDYLISKKIKIIFLTGRTAEQCEATKTNLINAGYVKIDTLICRKTTEAKLNSFKFKQNKFNELKNRGYDIIACVGDQPADVESGVCKIKILLPNYLYKLD